MNPQDWFVGGVATVLGGVLTYAATSDSAWFFELRRIKQIEKRVGRRRTKWISIIVGLTLILLGGAIASGGRSRFLPHDDESVSNPSRE
jgi:threonine/homoserine/homoserine lactone efflux protein